MASKLHEQLMSASEWDRGLKRSDLHQSLKNGDLSRESLSELCEQQYGFKIEVKARRHYHHRDGLRVTEVWSYINPKQIEEFIEKVAKTVASEGVSHRQTEIMGSKEAVSGSSSAPEPVASHSTIGADCPQYPPPIYEAATGQRAKKL